MQISIYIVCCVSTSLTCKEPIKKHGSFLRPIGRLARIGPESTRSFDLFYRMHHSLNHWGLFLVLLGCWIFLKEFLRIQICCTLQEVKILWCHMRKKALRSFHYGMHTVEWYRALMLNLLSMFINPLVYKLYRNIWLSNGNQSLSPLLKREDAMLEPQNLSALTISITAKICLERFVGVDSLLSPVMKP